MPDSIVLIGLDILQRGGFAPLRDQRVGLLVHPASVDRRLRHASRILHEEEDVELTCLFGPQHGILGQTQDNMVEWEGGTDETTGLPVFSLYGEHRKPTRAMLDHLDTLVVDLQDVGARYYTFSWTLLLAMEACAEAGKRMVVLDRPNPINGVDREGTILDMEYRSFVGMAPIPMRHGLTVGELATWFRARFELDLELEVVWSRNWRRARWHDELVYPWVLPSPNMPTLETATVYPGMCLLEGTELSEGRGTTRPFEIFGAPFIDAERLVERLSRFKLPGVRFRPMYFQPTFQKHAGTICGGAQIHLTDRREFRPVASAVAILSAVRELWPDEFRWKQPPYEYETRKLPIDILAGGPALREAVEAGTALDAITESWRPGLEAFRDEIQPFLHYE